MARHGENIRKRKDGRWEARYQITNAQKGCKTYRSVYGSTYEVAKEKRAAALRAAEKKTTHETGQTFDIRNHFRPQILFSEAANQWLEQILDKRKYSTYVKYRNVYQIHLEGVLGSCLLSDIPNPKLQKKISDHLLGSGLSDSVKKSACCVVNQILTFATREYFVCAPILKAELPKQEKRLVKTFTKPEQSQILTCIYGSLDLFKIALLLCMYTGIRLGELCALKWTDFDFHDGTVTVNRTVQRIAMKGYMTKTILMEGAPKSSSSNRTIPLTAEIMGLLEKLKSDNSYVFGGNKPLEPRTAQYWFQKILKEAGVDSRNFHILRHTFATNCVESGMDVKTLSVILGHSDVKITLNRYVHPTMDSKRRQMGLLSDFYGRIHGQVA